MQRRARQHTVIILLEVGGEVFGLPIAVVRDILRVCRVGRGTGWRIRGSTPGRMGDAGTIDVGGRLAPLVDLSASFGRPRAAVAMSRARSVLVVQSGERWLGLLVDAVGDIVEVPHDAITSVTGSGPHLGAICQIARVDDRVVGLLDADLLLPAGGHTTVA